MAKPKDPRLVAATQRWISAQSTTGANAAASGSASRKKTPSSASQADTRPDEGPGFTDPAKLPPTFLQSLQQSSDPVVRENPISLDDQAMQESPARVGDAPALPARDRFDDPIGVKSLYDRVMKQLRDQQVGGGPSGGGSAPATRRH